MDETKHPMKRVLRFLLVPPGPGESPGHLWPRWIFLRLLGVWFFSAFYSLWFQADGLIGPRGLLPAGDYLGDVARGLEGVKRLWYAPTIFWAGSSDGALLALCAFGMAASLLLVLNVWPRWAVAACTIAFLSFIAVLQDFASYQSDGMLLEAGLLSLFFAPAGFRPGLGARTPPSRLALFALTWLCFRIYFESGVVKWKGHDPEWEHLTAMDHYYENGPLPSWLAWWAQQELPHAFHRATAAFTLLLELVLCWAMLLTRRFKIALGLVLLPFQAGILLTSNYAFLNWLVFSLGLLLFDDRFLAHLGLRVPAEAPRPPGPARLWIEGVVLSWQIYATYVLLLFGAVPWLPRGPAEVLRPWRLANRYGLFAIMTRERDEIEFQGSDDGVTWTPYRFRYKPQDPKEPPGLYAPYQPRFEWNLWFASLGQWRQYPWVVRCEERLLEGSPEVLELFRGDPFHGKPPRKVRAVLSRYWFSTPAERRATGAYWDRAPKGSYAPSLER
ncbi:MAG TPA: lipase maturation factor family protein, partial [Myxococcales bacterium]|nr:lipase maturation factor family protein [Myxococcales bacterium]